MDGRDIPFGECNRLTKGGLRTLRCLTVGPEGVEVELHVVGTDPVRLRLSDHTSGVPPVVATLVEARGHAAVPSHRGDTTVVWTHVDL